MTRTDHAAADGFGHVERVGVEFIPEDQRHSTPGNVVTMFFGGNLAFSLVVLGSALIAAVGYLVTTRLWPEKADAVRPAHDVVDA